MEPDHRKLIGVMGSGLIGTDPFANGSWSGSSRFFFSECARQGILHRAYGVDISPARRAARIVANFARKRDLWRQQFYLDTSYYDQLSREIAARLGPGDEAHPLLQIGGIYDLRPLIGNSRRLFSYHDGNLALALKNPRFPSVDSGRVKRALDYERKVAANVDLIFTMSDYLRASFINDFGVAAEKVVTIGAGVNLDRIPVPRYDKNYQSKKILFIGVDFVRKGGEVLLRAFRKVRAVHQGATLCIIGPSRLEIPPVLADGVQFLGFLSKANPSERAKFETALSGASLFVMPSLYEPFGIAPLEAMLHQIPAVLTDAWAFPEMVTPGAHGELVRSGDDSDLADKLCKLLGDSDKLREMGALAREHVLTRFTWPAVVTRLRERLAAAPG